MAQVPTANDSIYATAEFVGFSLWLVPDVTAHAVLDAVIQKLATRLDTPRFSPHATLLGGVVGLEVKEAVDRSRRLAEGLRAMDAEISVVSSKELLFFQCVFALIKLSEQLIKAHHFAMEVFERTQEPEFMPHISLIYGDLSPEERMELARELGPEIDGMKMKMEKLQLWNTTGPVKNWCMVAEFALTSS